MILRDTPIKATLLFVFLSFSYNVSSGEYTGWRKIVDLGCNDDSGTCFVTVDGPAVSGSTGCLNNNLRWDVNNDPNGKSTLALLMMANGLGSRVAIYTARCYAISPTYSEIAFINIEATK